MGHGLVFTTANRASNIICATFNPDDFREALTPVFSFPKMYKLCLSHKNVGKNRQ